MLQQVVSRKLTDIICDVDKTLTESKAKLTPDMAAFLAEVTENRRLALISGCAYEQFQWQVIPQLEESGADLAKVTLLPTSGGAMYTYRAARWKQVYYHGISEENYILIENAIRAAVDAAQTEYDLEILLIAYGPQIEFRGSQVTFSALGQKAPPGPIKDDWDPDHIKRKLILKHLTPLLPDGVTASHGGSTSLDIVKAGIDKAYGIREYVARHPEEASIDTMIFFGDSLEEGGNDAPAKETGIRCVAVNGPDDTKDKLSTILEQSK